MVQVELKALQQVTTAVPASPAPKGTNVADQAQTAQRVPVRQQQPKPQPETAGALRGMSLRHQPTSQFIGRIVERAARTQSGADLLVKRQIFEPTNDIVTRVIDTSKGKVLREMPNLKYLILVANLMRLSGVLVDKKA